MRLKKNILASLLVLTSTSLALPALALAASGHAPHISHTIPYWVHFIAYVGIIFFLVRKKAVQGWAERRDSISTLVTRGERELEVARAKLREAETLLAGIDSEVSKISQAISNETENEIRVIQETAKARTQRIAKQAEELLETEQRSAEKSIQKELAESVIEKARGMLSGAEISDSDKARRKGVLSEVRSLV